MDAELRTLERAAIAGGARERLAWARALERAGRPDEAVAALVPVRNETAVRAHLQAVPSWSHPEADAGRTRFVDARPVVREPVARWTTRVATGEGSVLLASPLALAWPAEASVTVLDPATGRTRGVEYGFGPGAHVELRLATLVVSRYEDEHESAIDLFTGASRALGRRVSLARVRDRDLVVRLLETVVSGTWIGPDLTTRRRRWRYPRSGRLDLALRSSVDLAVGPGRVVLWGGGPFVVLDRATGAEIARGEGESIRVDKTGLAGVRGRAVFACDQDGRELWGRVFPGAPAVTALSPEFVVAHVGKRTLALDRRSGETIGVVGESLETLAVVGGVIYLTSHGGRRKRRLLARRTDGEELWSFELTDFVESLAVLDGRIYVAVSTRRPWTTSVLCLAEAT